MKLPTPEDLCDRRKELGLTQAELAERADVSQPLIARIEGDDVDPRLSTLRGIVTALEAAEDGITEARDLMNSPVVGVAPDDSVHQTKGLMDEKGYSQAPVIRDGAPQGLICDSDILQRREENIGTLPVAEVMNESIATVEPQTPLDMVESHLTHSDAVLVVDGGTTVGVITEADVASHLS
ncbi:MAG: putative transcriptional regulator with C-terminal CBS domain protein [halophilic archaeon J07HX5]|jgi:transcriptional regulator, XRE family|nr:MAG: putative transcriptional regulator with C-terminal CBS domain protein [halophilic archaeon J07HX5]